MTVTVEGFGEVTVDISYGGAFYAFINAQRFGLDVMKSRTRDLVDAATAVTRAVKAQVGSFILGPCNFDFQTFVLGHRKIFQTSRLNVFFFPPYLVGEVASPHQ